MEEGNDYEPMEVEAEVDIEASGQRRYWTVEVIDSEGVRKEEKLQARDVLLLQNGRKLVVPFSNTLPQPDGEASGLLGQFLGLVAKGPSAFPVSYDDWLKVPSSYKQQFINGIVKRKLYFENVTEHTAHKYVLKDLGSKWKGFRLRLYAKYHKDFLSREENIANALPGVPMEMWASFIDYRGRESTKKMCAQNKRNRGKLVVNHTGGSKRINLKKAEMKTGQPVSRGQMYIALHKKKDGRYSNGSQEICEKIAAIEARGEVSAVVAPNDSLGQVVGKEHSGRTRCVGSNLCPSQVFSPCGGSSNEQHRTNGAPAMPSEDSNVRIARLESDLQKEKALRKQSDASLAEVLREMGKPIPLHMASTSCEETSGPSPSTTQSSPTHEDSEL